MVQKANTTTLSRFHQNMVIKVKRRVKMADQKQSNKNTDKSPGDKSDIAAEVKPRKIMVMPLPQILDEIENSIGLADEAAKDARAAADEARKAGEKAAREAARVAAEAISKVEQTANNALQLAELLSATLREASTAIDKKLSGKR
jgi:hypothetical protein